jgi:hypothetical protein
LPRRWASAGRSRGWSATALERAARGGVSMRTLGDYRDEVADAWARQRF